MIIQCPSCSTKFAVDAGQLADVENPRFHCSRCDHFFEAPQFKAAVIEPVVEAAHQLDLLGEPDAPRLPASSAPHSSAPHSSAPQPAAVSVSSSSSPPTFSPEKRPRPNLDLDDHPPVFAAWPEDQKSGQPFEADLRAVHARLLQVPAAAEQSEEEPLYEEPELEAEEPLEEDELPTEEHEAFSDDDEDDELEQEFDELEDEHEADEENYIHRPAAPPLPVTPSPITPSPAFPVSARLEQQQSVSRSVAAPEATDFSEESYRSKDMGARPEDIWRETRRPVQRPPREVKLPFVTRYGLPVAGSVPLVMMLCVWWWSTHLGTTPQALRDLLYLQPVGMPQLAPAGLEVTDLRSSFVTLDDGSRVLEIRGNIFNASSKTFGKVKLEAKIFDEKSNELGRLIVDPRGELADAKIQALSARALTELQSEPISSFVRLNPSDKIPFRIVFTDLGSDDAPANVQWFSTRIYSIEPMLS